MKLFRNFVIGLVLLFVAPAFGQTTSKLCFQNGAACPLVTSSNPLPVSGTFSASLSGFTPNGNFASLTATNVSASTALPTGTSVALQNTGTTTVSCTLGVGSATATTNEIQVPASSTVFVTVGSNTFGACIDQSGSTSNVVVLAGGSGLGTGFGGGGGGGSTATPSGIVAANSTNSTNLKTSAGTVYGIQTANINATTPYFLKLYDKATAPICGTDTPVKRILIPPNNSGNNVAMPVGIKFSNGIGYCVTAGIADSDTTAVPAATVLINIDWN